MQTLFSGTNLPAVPAPSVSGERESWGVMGGEGGVREKKNHESVNPTEAGSFTLDRFSSQWFSKAPNSNARQLPPQSLRSLYMALFSCVKDAIAICFSFLFLCFFFLRWTGIFQNKRLEMASE